MCVEMGNAVKNAVLDRVMYGGMDDDYIVDKPCLMPDILITNVLSRNSVFNAISRLQKICRFENYFRK